VKINTENIEIECWVLQVFSYPIFFFCNLKILILFGDLIQGSNPGKVQRLCSSQKRVDRLWGPPCLLFSRYRRFSWGYGGRAVKFIAYLYLMWKLRMSGALPPLPLYLLVDWTTGCLFKLFTISSNNRADPDTWAWNTFAQGCIHNEWKIRAVPVHLTFLYNAE